MKETQILNFDEQFGRDKLIYTIHLKLVKSGTFRHMVGFMCAMWLNKESIYQQYLRNLFHLKTNPSRGHSGPDISWCILLLSVNNIQNQLQYYLLESCELDCKAFIAWAYVFIIGLTTTKNISKGDQNNPTLPHSALQCTESNVLQFVDQNIFVELHQFLAIYCILLKLYTTFIFSKKLPAARKDPQR